jgi:hypothetical protein
MSLGSAFLCVPSAFLTIGAGFAENLLPSFNAAEHPCVAFLGVSVLPLHTPLSACNRNTPLPVFFEWKTEVFPNFLAEVSI